ncbi:hypothetical protein SAMN04487936_103324 [Halobacillus dabanensis]|uniref:Uncharacterized protein n=1 Tax=Halobacillus dabanensis TaxID=240302 RepID=A0A1I3TFS9_HALDA|nr:hypothetical protein [Halobacillus dabanensis]SFJ68521.1 hypothetical protein SAMN04487936_103324 [Halobacillus dabanensis]
MRNMVGVLSTVLFLAGILTYLFTLFGYEKLLRVGVVLAFVGFMLSLFASSSVYQKIGAFGNGMILFFAILLPFFVTTFLWNQP